MTIGSIDLPAGGLGSYCSAACTAFQGQIAPATQAMYTLTSPVDGTISGWSFRNGSIQAGNSFALRVLRPTDASETQFTLVGTSTPQLVADNDDAVRGPFPASIPIKTGDRIGLESLGPFDFGVPVALTGQNDPVTGDGARYFQPDLADGQSGLPSNPGNSGQTVLVQAEVNEAPPPPPPPPPRPDFSLGLLGNPPSTFSMTPTGSVTIPLVVHRNDISRGSIQLSVAGLPFGATGSFQASQVDATGDVADPLTISHRRSLVIPALAPGTYPITVTATPLSASAGVTRSLSLTLVVLGQLQVQVQGLEVTQAVQTFDQPVHHTYRGVPLVAGKKTVANVIAAFTGTEASNSRRPPLGMTLWGYDSGGHALPSSPLLPEYAPAVEGMSIYDRRYPPDFFTNQRVTESAHVWAFVLPDGWTRRGPITLVAKAVSSNAAVGQATTEICSDESCGATPTFDVRGIGFVRTPAARDINLLGLITYDAKTGGLIGVPGPPARALAELQSLSPVPFRYIAPDGSLAAYPVYRAVWSAPNNQLWEAARDFDDSISHQGDSTFGLFVGSAGITIGRVAVAAFATDVDGNLIRPVTTIAHEMLHLLGLGHADGVVGGCGGNGDGKPDPQGRMESVGNDLLGSPPYRVIPDLPKNPAYDAMSYCGVETYDIKNWISALNWERLVAAAGTRDLRSRSAAVVGGHGLSVEADVDQSGVVHIFSVRAGRDPSAASPAASPYTLLARAANGAVVSSAPMSQQSASDAGGPASVLLATVGGVDIARVEIVSAGRIVAARDRSAHPPTATLLTPGKGTTIRGPLSVRWRASDPDADALQVALDISTDDGRTFHNVYGGLNRGAVTLPPGLLASSPRARVRLRVSDGFREAAAKSPRFTIAPRRPAVTILEPVPGGRYASGSVVFLHGGAMDSRAHAIRGSRLRWLAGRRALGRGEQLTAVIPAGTSVIRLLATDAAGRTGSASVAVRTPASIPFFTRLSAPPRLSRRARQVTLVVATTEPATLEVAGRRFYVGRRARRIRVPIHPGRTTLTLHLTLASAGKSIRETITVRRM